MFDLSEQTTFASIAHTGISFLSSTIQGKCSNGHFLTCKASVRVLSNKLSIFRHLSTVWKEHRTSKQLEAVAAAAVPVHLWTFDKKSFSCVICFVLPGTLRVSQHAVCLLVNCLLLLHVPVHRKSAVYYVTSSDTLCFIIYYYLFNIRC